jgi:hypothetical protein
MSFGRAEISLQLSRLNPFLLVKGQNLNRTENSATCKVFQKAPSFHTTTSFCVDIVSIIFNPLLSSLLTHYREVRPAQP